MFRVSGLGDRCRLSPSPSETEALHVQAFPVWKGRIGCQGSINMARVGGKSPASDAGRPGLKQRDP